MDSTVIKFREKKFYLRTFYNNFAQEIVATSNEFNYFCLIKDISKPSWLAASDVYVLINCKSRR